jgi:hypothetical protein
MTSTAPQHRPATHLINDQTPTAQHSSKTDKATETDSTATRSRPSHLCITIRGAGPASGGPAYGSSRVTLRVDLQSVRRLIVSGWSGWSGC